MAVPERIKHKYTQDVTDCGFFVLRSSALPVDEFIEWTSGLKAAQVVGTVTSSEQQEIAWNQDVQILRDRLKRLVDRSDIYQALVVASPSLLLGVAHWKADPDSKKGLQAERALVRYFTRMCTRATPFGLFAGCSIGRTTTCTSEAPGLLMQARQFHKTATRLDFDFLFSLTDALRRDKALLKELRFGLNTSIHRVGNGLHYVEAIPNGKGSSRTHNLVRIESNAYIDSVISQAESGGATFSDLVDAVLKHHDPDISQTDAEVFVYELISNNVLIPSLSPQVTGATPLGEIIQQLELLPAGRHAADVLSTVRDRLAALDHEGIGVNPSEYQRVTSVLERLPAKFDPARLYQVDMIKPAENVVLTQPIVDALIEAVEVLCRLHVPNEPEHLTSFKKAFVARYDDDFVPLLEALDEETGVGFGAAGTYESSILRELKLSKPEVAPMKFTWANTYILDKIASCALKGASEVRFELSDIPDYNDPPSRLPVSFSLSAELIASSQAALRAGEFEVLVNGIDAPYGAKTLGRFCHSDPLLAEHVRQYLGAEQNSEPDSILAEIVHLPEGREGNVICRPVLRNYEIVFLGRSGAPRQCQIPASDLLVAVDESEGICLYSRRLRRRVIPSLSSAHTYSDPIASPVYRFLASLQHQNRITTPGFSLGLLAAQLFLPRITVGRIVIATARWRLMASELDKLISSSGWRTFAAAREFQRARSLPRFVEFKETDNLLLVDFDNPLSVDAFVHVLKRRQKQGAVVREVYPSAEQLCATSNEGRFWHELHVPMLCHSTATTVRRQTRSVNRVSLFDGEHATARSFIPGSEWLFLKVYGGRACLDRILKSHIHPIVRNAIAESCISQWFFVRYADPQQHLRLRFKGDALRLQRELLPVLSNSLKPLLDSRVLWKIQLDTYVREIERYGGHKGILLSEEIFHADSDAVIELLNSLNPADELDSRWRLALLGTALLLSDVSLSENENLTLLAKLRADFSREFEISPEDKKKLSERFRTERSWADAILDKRVPEGWDEVWANAMDVFGRRSARVRNAVAKLRTLSASGELVAPIADLMRSYMHMHINRMMRASAREHELIIYEFLFRAHDSHAARCRNTMRSAIHR